MSTTITRSIRLSVGLGEAFVAFKSGGVGRSYPKALVVGDIALVVEKRASSWERARGPWFPSSGEQRL